MRQQQTNKQTSKQKGKKKEKHFIIRCLWDFISASFYSMYVYIEKKSETRMTASVLKQDPKI